MSTPEEQLIECLSSKLTELELDKKLGVPVSLLAASMVDSITMIHIVYTLGGDKIKHAQQCIDALSSIALLVDDPERQKEASVDVVDEFFTLMNRRKSE